MAYALYQRRERETNLAQIFPVDSSGFTAVTNGGGLLSWANVTDDKTTDPETHRIEGVGVKITVPSPYGLRIAVMPYYNYSSEWNIVRTTDGVPERAPFKDEDVKLVKWLSEDELILGRKSGEIHPVDLNNAGNKDKVIAPAADAQNPASSPVEVEFIASAPIARKLAIVHSDGTVAIGRVDPGMSLTILRTLAQEGAFAAEFDRTGRLLATWAESGLGARP